MASIILSPAAIEQLKSVAMGVEVRDGEGNLIGTFYPAVNPTKVAQAGALWPTS